MYLYSENHAMFVFTFVDLAFEKADRLWFYSQNHRWASY